MCGIAGYSVPSPGPQGRLAEALQKLRRRGPNDSGTAYFRDEGTEAALGSTRLAIVDLSSAGHMPMYTADASCAIAFNGEIYDAPVHRQALQERGVNFRSRTDTEVLLYGLALEGPAFLDRVDGMYALAFWDSRGLPTLTLARDRFGEKPLFIAESGGAIFFASEIAALVCLLGKTPEVDERALGHVLQWGYPPADGSSFKGIRKLKPGAWEQFGRRVRCGALAPLGPTREIESATDVAKAAALVREAVCSSVRDRLMADVPAGVFLSGGLDSAAVASIAARGLPRGEQLNTYTVGYAGSSISELQPARRMSEWLGTRHHEVLLDDSSLSALPWIVASLGEPVADPACLPTYFLSAAARRTSTVLLTGEGADEIFFGYPRYLWHDIAGGAPYGTPAGRGLGIAAGRALRRVRSAPVDPASRDLAWKGASWPVRDLMLDSGAPWRNEPNGSGQSSARWSRGDDLARWLPESVLVRVDRMTMAASIEARAPFLGRETARLGMHLRDGVLRRFPFGKYALRAAMKEYLPFSKRWGIKRPFSVPLADWLLGPLRPLFDEVFFGERLLRRGWFRREGLRTLGHAALSRNARAVRTAWTVLTLELWARAHVDGESPQPPDLERTAEERNGTRRSRQAQLVLAIDFPPEVGGIQLYNKQIWSDGGLGDVTVVAGATPGYEAFDRTFPGRVIRLRQSSGYAGRVRHLAGVFGNVPRCLSRGAVIHVAHAGLAPAIFPYAALFRNPVVAWTHALELTNPRLAVPIRWLLGRADRVVVVSEYTRGLAVERGARPDRIVKISPAGDDLRAMYPNPDARSFRNLHSVRDGDFLILSVGRASPFNRYKGFDRLIEAAAALVRRGRPFRWLVIGGGPDLPVYREQVREQGLGAEVSFLGSVDDETLAAGYSACDLFCLLSREEVTARGILAEGFGIVYAQASSFGKPVLGLRRGGVPDAVLDGATGVLVDEDDAEVIASKIEAMMDSPTERERLGRNGVDHACGIGSWAAARQRVRHMLETL